MLAEVQELRGAWEFIGVKDMETQTLPTNAFPEKDLGKMTPNEMREAARKLDSTIHGGGLIITYGPAAIIESPDGLKSFAFSDTASLSKALSDANMNGNALKQGALSEALSALTSALSAPAAQQTRAPVFAMAGGTA